MNKRKFKQSIVIKNLYVVFIISIGFVDQLIAREVRTTYEGREDWIQTTFAGIGIYGRSGFSGDGGPAMEAALSGPSDIAIDASGSLYIADAGNDRIRRVNPISPDGIITTIAGSRPIEEKRRSYGDFSGDGGPATQARLGLATN